ncbi:Met18p [Sugiyamaella lignohabitans]|uniref:MMS19 nucleotide excision repair protein n=1 Tax=Sugiyamaella lignohabitans TaxID=796027 RepID=A0A167FJX7_9ASCO|nr:Met18p [Sugiyamaella lignohabitans]ANB15396.1 Met18p [Sugiyamaella lignohabitans]
MKEGINMKKHSQNTRYLVFDLLSSILERFHETGKLDENEFIETYIYLTSGEKDPRNLLASFKISHGILANFGTKVLSQHKEDLFDVVFCYFPITFEPPKNDPYGITSKDLKDGLTMCIVGSDVLASEAFPALIEKLNSTSPTVKQDALTMINSCLENYSGSSLRSNGLWKDIWDGIKYEVLHGSDEVETATLALGALIKLAASVAVFDQNGLETSDVEIVDSYHNETVLESSSNGNDVATNVLNELLTQVKNETKDKLEEPQSKLALPAGTLIAGMAQANVVAFESLSSFAVPILLEAVQSSSTIDRQVGVLTILTKFLVSSGRIGSKDNAETYGNSSVEPLLAPYKDRIFEFFSRSLMGSSKSETKLRLLAVDGLTILAQLPGLLASDEIGLIIQYLNNIVLKEEDDELSERALLSLVKMTNFGKQDQIINITFPTFLASLPEDYYMSAETSLEVQKSPEYVLSALARLSTSRPIFEVLSVRLLGKLEVIRSVKYIHVILLTLLSALRKLSDQDDLSFYFEKFVPKLISKLVSPTSTLKDDQTVDTVAQIVAYTVQRVTATQQQLYVNEIFAYFNGSGEYSTLVGSEPVQSFLSPEATPSNLVSFLTTTISPVDPKVQLPVDKLSLIKTLIEVVAKSKSVFERTGYLRFIALITNKYIEADNQLKKVHDSLLSEVETRADVNSLEILTWLAKGLLLRNSSLGYQIADSLVNLLSQDSLTGRFAARLVAVLVAHDRILTKENKLVIRQLYKQKLFALILPKLVDGFKAGHQRVNFMVALSGLLQYTPSTIITPQLSKFLPLLLESFDIQDTKVQEAAINTIIVTLHEAADTFAHHISTMIPKLLKLSQDYQKNSASVRSAALVCLGSFPKTISLEYVLPYRNIVIKGLSTVLDDPRRSVRADAVLCRQSYYELGQ